MISGTYILTDTINNGFNTIVVNSYKNADVVISGDAAFKNTNGNGVETPTFPAVRAREGEGPCPDVAAAAGSVTSDNVKLIGKDGKVDRHGRRAVTRLLRRPARAAVQPDEADRRVLAERRRSGRDRQGDRVAARASTSGDTIELQTVGPQRSFHISGIAELTGVGSIGGATFALFDLPTAQRVFASPVSSTSFESSRRPESATAKLVSEIKPLLPPTATVRDANAQVKEDKKDLSIVSFLKYILLAFAGIALFVGAFVIANTLAITIAQRMREFATLRTLGASRRQVLWSVVIEAFVIGLLGSLIGFFLGLGLAKLLNKLFVTFGIDLPQGQTVFATRTVIVSLLVGTVVTLVASIRPARRATRVPPIAAVREGSVLPVSRFAKYGPVTALGILVAAIALVALGSARQRHRNRAAPAVARGRRSAAVLRRLDERGAGRSAARGGRSALRLARSAALRGSWRATTRHGTRRGRPPRPPR